MRQRRFDRNSITTTAESLLNYKLLTAKGFLPVLGNRFSMGHSFLIAPKQIHRSIRKMEEAKEVHSVVMTL